MQIRLLIFGWVKVNNNVDTINVQASRRDIGSDQDCQVTRTKIGKCFFTLTLSKITVNSGGVHTFFLQLLNEAISTAFGASKNDGLVVRLADGGGHTNAVHLVNI